MFLLYLNATYVDAIGPNHVTGRSLKRTSYQRVKIRCNTAQ